MKNRREKGLDWLMVLSSLPKSASTILIGAAAKLGRVTH